MLWLVKSSLEKLEEGRRYEEALSRGDNKNLRAIGRNMTGLIPQITRTLSLYIYSKDKIETQDSLVEILDKIPDDTVLYCMECPKKRLRGLRNCFVMVLKLQRIGF